MNRNVRAGLLPAVALAVALAGPAATAAVYKWTDAQGNVHFSDKPPPGSDEKAQGSVKQMQLQDAYTGVSVPTLVPIRNRRSDGGPALGLSGFTLRLDSANSSNVTVGRAFYGRSCEQSVDLLWNDGMLDMKGRKAEALLVERFTQAGYSLNDEAGGPAELALDAELVKLKVDTCNVNGERTRAYLKLRWTLKSGGGEELFRGISEGAHDGWNSNDSRSIMKALARAADNLLGDRNFIEALDGGPPRAALVELDEAVGASFGRGAGGGSFRERSTQLLAAAVTVETSRGHGSGVVIDPAGYVLTNAHVVGQDRAVRVLIDGKSVSGRVVRRHAATDVALIQVTAEGLTPVTVATQEPRPGDPLYVIGTPLSLKLSHTVTQGILSAVRNERGRRLYQTDASINPGNSGGPVFDASGELVALSVAGLFTPQGSSLNVNYLIPVEQALGALKVAER
ncbi:trypsin-like peptidase domain-containing protein [Tahibacter harae]|uniref:Trypsin-like peptidase domain-containing protein n=1 Tax=Tahibacter harae TaxID=2963937 RepID=A0ABT1QLJ8_9GAMM|nr:trypsin-like peptidase domain-containing protein [Tahibacter harae]MCQ4163411.1 trypsin-like peptidase domain-containing protein [Tahibacter harae]